MKIVRLLVLFASRVIAYALFLVGLIFFNSYWPSFYIAAGLVRGLVLLLVFPNSGDVLRVSNSFSTSALLKLAERRAGRVRMWIVRIFYALKTIVSWPAMELAEIYHLVGLYRARQAKAMYLYFGSYVPKILTTLVLPTLACGLMMAFAKDQGQFLNTVLYVGIIVGLGSELLFEVVVIDYSAAIRRNAVPPLITFLVIAFAGLVAALVCLAAIAAMMGVPARTALEQTLNLRAAVDLLLFSSLWDSARPAVTSLIDRTFNAGLAVAQLRDLDRIAIAQGVLGVLVYGVLGRWALLAKNLRRQPAENLELAFLHVMLGHVRTADRFANRIPEKTAEGQVTRALLAATHGDSQAFEAAAMNLAMLRMMEDDCDWAAALSMDVAPYLREPEHFRPLVDLQMKTSSPAVMIYVFVLSLAASDTKKLDLLLDAISSYRGEMRDSLRFVDFALKGAHSDDEDGALSLLDDPPADLTDLEAIAWLRMLAGRRDAFLGSGVSLALRYVRALEDCLLALAGVDARLNGTCQLFLASSMLAFVAMAVEDLSIFAMTTAQNLRGAVKARLPADKLMAEIETAARSLLVVRTG